VTRPEPPSGVNPPAAVGAGDGTSIDLAPLATRLCDLYFDAYPDDVERYGPAGRAWCDHDSRYLLAWALEDARAGTVDTVEQVVWLGRVLAGRSFPVERLARHVGLTADVLAADVAAPLGPRAAERARDAADALPSHEVGAS
jgi:hypothetical protein